MVAGSAAVACAVAAAIAAPVLLLDPKPVAQPDSAVPSSAPAVKPAAATTDPHAADRPDFSFTVAAGPVAGYEVRPVTVTRDYQVATIVAAGRGEPVAHLTLYRAGTQVRVAPFGWLASADDPAVQPNAEVNGSPALVEVTGEAGGVQWQYAPDSVAVIHTGDAGVLPEQVLVEIAENVHFVDPYPARVPFRLDYLPDLLPLYAVVVDPSAPSASVQFINDSDDNARGADVMVATDPDSFREINPEYQDWDWRPVTIAGRAGRCVNLIDGRRCEVSYGDVLVSMGSGQLTSAELDQLVAGLHLADLDDPATWFDIDDAIPA